MEIVGWFDAPWWLDLLVVAFFLMGIWLVIRLFQFVAASDRDWDKAWSDHEWGLGYNLPVPPREPPYVVVHKSLDIPLPPQD